MAQFALDQLSRPLPVPGLDEVVFELDLGLQRPGWAIVDHASACADPLEELVVEALNTEVSRTSWGVTCARLMRGLRIEAAGHLAP
ncbi:hypothetical protein FSW04_19670 [Baekduia soli]|uniref:Uncharacterized protein n=1 Tax=Baekduia soli TaxID=496014 RepID=A0A5B8U8U9_9ACTN|nr:hypothetical protein [Baekduia soli]QEC49569.1 hypothetical protein FSW04_19670 [Baekduia soli]